MMEEHDVSQPRFQSDGWDSGSIGADRFGILHGFTDLTLVATLTGEPLYVRHGFEAVRRYATPLTNGGELPMVEMRKQLGIHPGR